MSLSLLASNSVPRSRHHWRWREPLPLIVFLSPQCFQYYSSSWCTTLRRKLVVYVKGNCSEDGQIRKREREREKKKKEKNMDTPSESGDGDSVLCGRWHPLSSTLLPRALFTQLQSTHSTSVSVECLSPVLLSVHFSYMELMQSMCCNFYCYFSKSLFRINHLFCCAIDLHLGGRQCFIKHDS